MRKMASLAVTLTAAFIAGSGLAPFAGAQVTYRDIEHASNVGA